MLSFLTRIFSQQNHSPSQVEQLYDTLITQSRTPVFYEDYGVADTVEGRLEMIYLHLFMVFNRLKRENTPLKQDLFDLFLEKTDANLREMAVGDLKVPKLMKAVGQNFYGRSKAYEGALISSENLITALKKNISLEKPEKLCNYVFETIQILTETSLEALPNFIFLKPQQ